LLCLLDGNCFQFFSRSWSSRIYRQNSLDGKGITIKDFIVVLDVGDHNSTLVTIVFSEKLHGFFGDSFESFGIGD